MEQQIAPRARLAWLDILKGFGIILVVLGHVYQNDLVFDWIYSFHMPLFFVAAGFVYKLTPVLKHIKRRLFTVIVPYFSFGLIILFYWYFIERRFRASGDTLLDAFLGLLRGQYNLLEFNVHLWFLPCFFLTVVLFNILVNIDKKKRLAFAVSALATLLFILFDLPELPWGINRVCQYIGFYALGHLMACVNAHQLVQKQHKAVQGAIAVALLALNFALVAFLPDIPHRAPDHVLYLVIAAVGVLAFMTASLLIQKAHWLECLGRSSLTILCLHGPVYRVIVKILSMVLSTSTDAVRMNALFAILCSAVTLGICFLCHFVIARILPWMVGQKPKPKKAV